MKELELVMYYRTTITKEEAIKDFKQRKIYNTLKDKEFYIAEDLSFWNIYIVKEIENTNIEM